MNVRSWAIVPVAMLTFLLTSMIWMVVGILPVDAGGVLPGDLVAVNMPNLAWWPVVALGVWRAGAVISLASTLAFTLPP